jgi:hypothetical protein
MELVAILQLVRPQAPLEDPLYLPAASGYVRPGEVAGKR